MTGTISQNESVLLGILTETKLNFEVALNSHRCNNLIGYPKSGLHTHAMLGGSRSFVRERTGVDIAPLDRVLTSMTEMHEWVSANRIGEAFLVAAVVTR